MEKVGSRANVMYGLAQMTAGGLTKKDLMYNTNARLFQKERGILE